MTWDLVLKRNSVERLKREKPPLGIVDELPALIAAGYENVAEEDIVRLKWWGLYHDKPKIGTFMLRIKLPAGLATPAQLRTIGEVSNRYGRGSGELSTRQNVQLHYLELAALPDVLAGIEAAGLTTAGGCGDAVRNITGCPVSGLAHDELFDATPVVEEAAEFFYGNPEYSDLPRKHKITIAACADRCNAPEINCISFVGVLRDGQPGFAVLVGGGLSSVPRLARDLGVFVRLDEALPVMRALLDAWKEDPNYRISRVKARMKFMVDDLGPEGMRAECERRLGYRLPDYELPPPPAFTDHIGVHDQRDPDLVYIGVPVHLGLASGDQMIAVADLAERLGGDVRITRQQNFVLTSVPGPASTRPPPRWPRSATRWKPRPRAAARSRAPASRTATSPSPRRRRAWTTSSSTWRAASARRSPASGSTSTAARTPARTTGRATSVSRGRPSATRTAASGRRTTSTCAAGSARTPRSRGRSSAAWRPTG